jgi:hypothetical protein
MSTLSFRQYVLSHSPEDSPAGDFIADAKHPSQKIPDAKKWQDIENWLLVQGASQDRINAAQIVWKRYLRAKDLIPIPLGTGLTVRDMITLLQGEAPDAHVIKYHPKGAVTASRVLGFSRVSISSGSRVIPAVMLE